MMHRNRPPYIRSSDATCTEEWRGLPQRPLHLDHNTWRDRRKRRAQYPLISVRLVLLIFRRSVRNRLLIERMHLGIFRDDPRLNRRPLVVPRFPVHHDAIPLFRSLLREDLVHEIVRIHLPSLVVEAVVLLLFEHESVGADRNRHSARRVINDFRVARKMHAIPECRTALRKSSRSTAKQNEKEKIQSREAAREESRRCKPWVGVAAFHEPQRGERVHEAMRCRRMIFVGNSPGNVRVKRRLAQGQASGAEVTLEVISLQADPQDACGLERNDAQLFLTNRRLTEGLRQLLSLPKDRLIHGVPPIRVSDAHLDLTDDPFAAVRVRHDHNPVAFSHMRHQMTAESPISPAVAEVPALSFLLNLKSHCKRAGTRWRNHLSRGRLLQYLS